MVLTHGLNTWSLEKLLIDQRTRATWEKEVVWYSTVRPASLKKTIRSFLNRLTGCIAHWTRINYGNWFATVRIKHGPNTAFVSLPNLKRSKFNFYYKMTKYGLHFSRNRLLPRAIPIIRGTKKWRKKNKKKMKKIKKNGDQTDFLWEHAFGCQLVLMAYHQLEGRQLYLIILRIIECACFLVKTFRFIFKMNLHTWYVLIYFEPSWLDCSTKSSLPISCGGRSN